MKQYKKNSRERRETAHRLLYYLSEQTSAKYPEWRDATIKFLWDLYEIRDRNPAISVVVHKTDGIYVYHDAKPIAYFHIRKQHLLVMAAHGWLLWSKKRRPFKTAHHGSWPIMWRCTDAKEIEAFIRLVKALPAIKPQAEFNSRYIPQQVREAVLKKTEVVVKSRTA